MKYSYKIIKAKIAYDHADKCDFIRVTIHILLGKKKPELRHFGFKLDTNKGAIRAELDRLVVSLDIDAENTLKNDRREAILSKANKTIKDLINE